MDLLSGLLGSPRARDAFVLRAVLEPPWSIRVEDRAPLSLVAVLRGSAWVVPDEGPPRALRAGGVGLVRGPEPCGFADDPITPPQVVIDPGQHCRTLTGRPLAEEMRLGVRTWGNDPLGSTVLLVATYERTTSVGERLLAALPHVTVLEPDSWSCPLLPVLAEEIAHDEPGQEAVLDRLVDLVVVAALRSWLARDDGPGSAWYRAHTDTTVGRALRLLHHNLAHPWTVGGLAGEAGVSRAVLARRFQELVGRPPMAYLTELRLAVAADLLVEPETTLDAVATAVGYGSGFALSAAFTRVRGTSPTQHRRAAAAG